MFSINFTWGRSSSMGSSGSMLAKVTLLSLLCLSSFLGVQSGQSDRELTAAGGQLSTSSPTPNSTLLNTQNEYKNGFKKTFLKVVKFSPQLVINELMKTLDNLVFRTLAGEY